MAFILDDLALALKSWFWGTAILQFIFNEYVMGQFQSFWLK